MDAKVSYYYDDSSGKLDYVIVFNKKEKKRSRKYKADKQKKEVLVKLDSKIKYEGKVLYEFHSTERFYFQDAFLCVFLGAMIEYHDERGKTYRGTGNTHKDGTGFPSVSHAGGCAGDFDYYIGEDQFLINKIFEWKVPKSKILIGHNYSYNNATNWDDHNSHIHIGDYRDVKFEIK